MLPGPLNIITTAFYIPHYLLRNYALYSHELGEAIETNDVATSKELNSVLGFCSGLIWPLRPSDGHEIHVTSLAGTLCDWILW